MSPLTDREFDQQLERLSATYGEKAFSGERQQLIWHYVKTLPAHSFKVIVDRIIEQERYAPMPKLFKELAYKEKARLGIESPEWPRPVKPSAEADCHWCGDSGAVSLQRRPGTESWNRYQSTIVRCSCRVGRSGPRTWGEQWNQRWDKGFFRVAQYPSGHGNWGPTAKATFEEKAEALRSLKQIHENEQKGKRGKGQLVSFDEVFNSAFDTTKGGTNA